jgi:hypothetical protein
MSIILTLSDRSPDAADFPMRAGGFDKQCFESGIVGLALHLRFFALEFLDAVQRRDITVNKLTWDGGRKREAFEKALRG